MRQRVLSRAVTGDDGRVYPEGTPLDRLPESNRESVLGTGWTRPAPVDDSSDDPTSEQSDGDSAPDASAVSTAATDSADTGTAAETPAGETPADVAAATGEATDQPVGDGQEAADAAASETDESPAIASLNLSPELIELLAGAGIATVAQAIEHRTAHGSFRTIKKVGKASDALITAAIDG